MNLFYSKFVSMLVLSIMLICTSASAKALSPIQAATAMPGTSEEGMRAVDLDQPFTVPLNEWVQLRDSPDQFTMQIAYLESDNRCPSGVSCAVRGQAVFMLLFSLNGTVGDDLLPIGEYTSDQQNRASFAGYTVELLAVEPPAPKHTETLDLADYQVTFVIHADEAQTMPAATSTPEQAPTALFTPTPISSNGDELNAALGQPFDLRVEQTGKVAEVDFSLTFRSVSDDSGCFSADDCSTMSFDGTLALRRGDETLLLTLTAGFQPETPVRQEFAGLEVQLIAIRKLSDDSHVVTFVVIDPSVSINDDQPREDRPKALPLDRCASFSRFDAAALLQEDVETHAVANLFFGPTSESLSDLLGLCGYVSQAPASTRPADPTAPTIATALDSAHAVAATLPFDLLELLPIVEALQSGDSQPDDSTIARLKTYIAAGNDEQIIPLLLEATEQSQSIKAEAIEGVADKGAWFWKEFAGGRFAVLMIYKEFDFAVVAALLGDQVNELTVRDYATVVARSLLERRIDMTAQLLADEPPQSQPPTDTPSATDCDLISADDAAAILGEAVHAQIVDDPKQGCGYVAARELSPNDESFSMSDVRSAVVTQRLTGTAIEEMLTELATTLSEGVEGENENAQLIFNATMLTGNYEQALLMLVNIADGSKLWRVEELDGVDKTALFLWGQVGGRRLAAFVTIDKAGDVIVVVARLPNSRRRADVREAVVTLAEKLVGQQ